MTVASSKAGPVMRVASCQTGPDSQGLEAQGFLGCWQRTLWTFGVSMNAVLPVLLWGDSRASNRNRDAACPVPAWTLYRLLKKLL